jgi:hypothetical protein
VNFWEPEDKFDGGAFRPNWFQLDIHVESEVLLLVFDALHEVRSFCFVYVALVAASCLYD